VRPVKSFGFLASRLRNIRSRQAFIRDYQVRPDWGLYAVLKTPIYTR
jgi:hypothetical protein